jgi:hypothetical protein
MPEIKGIHAGTTKAMTNEPIPERSERPAKPEQPTEGFDEGQSAREALPEDENIGRFSEGQEELPEADPEKHIAGRFSEGQEELPEEDLEKHAERRFSEGQDAQPPTINP